MPEIAPTESYWDASGEHQGEPHVLVLLAVTPSTGPFSDGEMEYEVEHPPTCKQEEVEQWEGFKEMRFTCDLQAELDNIDLPFTLKYSGTPLTEPGRYRVQTWHTKSYIFDYGTYEYDGGIGVIDYDEPDHGRQPLTAEDLGRIGAEDE